MNRKGLKNIFVWSFLLFGAVAAFILSPWFYRFFPSDYSRTGVLLKTLEKKELKPKMVLFGSSVLMAGIDAKLLSKELGGGLVLNLSSTGQLFRESRLFYQSIDSSYTKRVIQFVNLDELERSTELKRKVARNFLLYNYSLKNRMLFDSIEIDLLMMPKWKIAIEARGSFISAINGSVRKILRKDLELDRVKTDLYLPLVYAQTIPKKKYQILIKRYNPPTFLDAFQLDAKVANLLFASKRYFNQKGIDYSVVLFPVNPDLNNYSVQYKREAGLDLIALGLDVIDMTNVLLEPQDFHDHCHPTTQGQKKMTLFLANELKRR